MRLGAGWEPCSGAVQEWGSEAGGALAGSAAPCPARCGEGMEPAGGTAPGCGRGGLREGGTDLLPSENPQWCKTAAFGGETPRGRRLSVEKPGIS